MTLPQIDIQPINPPPPKPQGINLRALLEEMVSRNASDLHIVTGERPKLRIDGDITNSSVEHELTAKDTLQIAYSVLTEQQKKRFELDDELDFSFGIQNLARFRGNCFKQRGCVSMVVRQIPHTIKTFEQLGLPGSIAKMAEKPRGLVLVTGPTGSGKSTTLAAMIDKINKERKGHIITVEDPIEFIHKHQGCIVNQREVGSDTKSFQNALKYALREDPDVILVGEMRDLETIQAALAAAETGHLVLSTLHTIDATETVNRIVDFFPPYQQQQIRVGLAGALKGILCQRLMPRTGGGRIPAIEVMINTGRTADLIVDPLRTAGIADIIREGAFYGMQTFDQALISLVMQGLVEIPEALDAASNRHDFQLALEQAGIDVKQYLDA